MFCMPMMDVHTEHSTEAKQCHFIPIADAPEVGQVVMLHPKDVYFTDEQEKYLRYIEQRFARNEQWIENDWKIRGLPEK